jgi:type IV pilus assembly protein PilM
VRNGVINDPAAVVKALKALWRKGRFSTRKVVMGLADSGVLTRQIELPWMPEEDFRAALKYQVADSLPVDLSTVELDYHLLGEGEKKDDHGQPMELNRILIVAGSTDAVMSEVDVVRRAHLEPVVADSTAFALIRAACAGVLPADEEVHAIADMGADQLTVVVHQAGQPRFIRTISNLGGDTATDAVADRLSVSPEDAERLKRESGLNGPAPLVASIPESTVFGGVIEKVTPVADPRMAATVDVLNPWATSVIGEIRNSIDYFQSSNPGVPVRTLTISGRTAELGGMVERIATQIPLPVRVVDPLLGLPASRGVTKLAPEDSRFVIASGLAMGA